MLTPRHLDTFIKSNFPINEQASIDMIKLMNSIYLSFEDFRDREQRHLEIYHSGSGQYEAHSIHAHNLIIFDQKRFLGLIGWTGLSIISSTILDKDATLVGTITAIILLLKDFNTSIVKKTFDPIESKIIAGIYFINKTQFTLNEIRQSVSKHFPDISEKTISDVINDLVGINLLDFAGSFYRLTEEIKVYRNKHDYDKIYFKYRLRHNYSES